MAWYDPIGDLFTAGLDIATDFIPGGDYIDDWLGIGGPSGGNNLGITPPTMGNGGNVVAMPLPAPANGRAVTTGMNQGYHGCQITLPLSYIQVAKAPAGYVAVDTNGDGINDTAMLKEVAIACKLWKRPPKPLLTASDRKALNKASRVMNTVDRVVAQTNKLRGQAKLTKSRPKSRR
jgi:hypothetical protein